MLQLRTHGADLNRALTESLSPRARFDATASILADVLDDATSRPSPYKTFRYLERFTQKNQVGLTQLVAELEPWIADMGQGEKLRLAASALSQPYGRKLMVQVPKVTKMMEENNYKLSTLDKLMALFRLRKVIKRK